MRSLGSAGGLMAIVLAGCVASAPASVHPETSPGGGGSHPPSPTTSSPTATPVLTDPPIPTVLVPASSTFTAGLRYICGSTPFPIEVLEGPGEADQVDDPAAAFLATGNVTADDWWLVQRSDDRAEFVGYEASRKGFAFAIGNRDAKGEWTWTTFGSCTPYPELQGRGATDRVTWWIRKSDWPTPGDRELRIRARDFCPETLSDRLREPTIRFGTERILMILSAEETSSYCNPEDQVAEVTIHLSEPVGNRSLWDGSEWPGRDAHLPTEPRGVCCG